MLIEKQCSLCKKVKLRADFYLKRGGSKDALMPKCKKCNNELRNKRLYALPVSDRRQIWRKQTERTQSRLPGHSKARTEVNKAIKHGELVRLPCEVCKEPKTQAHHDDYTKALNVRWLCHRHHRATHYPESYKSM